MLKLKYLEDSNGCYDFLRQDLIAEGEVNSALGLLFALNQEKALQAFLRQVSLVKQMDKLVKQQIMLVEAANAMPYGWKVANHLESEQGIFSVQVKTHTKALREAEGFVRRDHREFNTRRKDIKKRGGTRFGRGLNHSKRGGFTPGPNNRVNNWALKHIGFPAQQVAAKYNRTGTPLACFKRGDTGHLIKQCPKK